MNILFLSLLDFDSFEERSLYSDLLRSFIRRGHTVHCISPVEKRTRRQTQLIESGGNRILKLQIGDTQKVNIIRKGLSLLQIEPLFIRAIQKYFSDVRFDAVLYATPPVTFSKVIRFVKKRDGARSYLMLKDIFPQNAVDLGMMSLTGPKSVLYHYFRSKEKQLYALSDRIGCMSQANVDYLLRHNPEVPAEHVGLCPNSAEVQDLRLTDAQRVAMRAKYGIPADKKVIVYGGNLGRPQNIPFLVRALKECAAQEDVYFVIAGSGTDRPLLEAYVEEERPSHVLLLGHLPKEEYDHMIACCDIGLILLDYRFTIPNFPSRLLSYMQAGLPVLACTDPNTDIGKTVAEGGFGWQCGSNDPAAFAALVARITGPDADMQERELAYLRQHFSSDTVCATICRALADAEA
ncbi:MAG: glycosyltransferase family 4 protein [Clostridia bacterium]|nr:glycosyltransferase family 4 protein [Clostridia bacterium]